MTGDEYETEGTWTEAIAQLTFFILACATFAAAFGGHFIPAQ